MPAQSWIDDTIRVLDGEDAYLRMLDDVYHATRKKTGSEVLFFYSSDRCTRAGEYEAEKRIRAKGTRFRSLIEEGNTTTTWPSKEYRQIPKKYFYHNLQIIYNDKVAQMFDGGKTILIIDNAPLATTARNTFNLLWSLMPAPPEPRGGHG